ncbi:hypothetical protein E4U13_004238 [Claviceps humidiphila]|uniref:Uncharacterized protein n=2 Tax=Claviceps TaxID=5110 RepID=A0A9P7SRY0_9HYPO|nr:hypothetical protein E4U57_007091 [Claviceps arundinis]KAG5977477.1 hypothetical protein E4U56_007780 [Claviceps arundinis]KAG6121632.1 hypothetical protein E4U13_004238 [Claviceps humidiphila]
MPSSTSDQTKEYTKCAITKTLNHFVACRAKDACRGKHTAQLASSSDGHSDITIDEDVLNHFPDDGDVNAELQTEEVEPVDLEDPIAEIDPPP